MTDKICIFDIRKQNDMENMLSHKGTDKLQITQGDSRQHTDRFQTKKKTHCKINNVIVNNYFSRTKANIFGHENDKISVNLVTAKSPLT